MAGSSIFKIFLLLVIFTSFLAIDVNARKSSRHNKTRTKKLSTRKFTDPRYMKYICLEDDNHIVKSSTSLGISCKCPSIRAPVCGSDNITYHNRCFMHCRARHATNLYHRYRLTLKHFGECQIDSTQPVAVDEPLTNASKISSIK